MSHILRFDPRPSPPPLWERADFWVAAILTCLAIGECVRLAVKFGWI